MVLIAEDNEAIQMAMKIMLDTNNVEYELCWNGNEATEKFEEYLSKGKMFDIILMDLYMPQKDGF
jgi:CheY-like chemotaxis protein